MICPLLENVLTVIKVTLVGNFMEILVLGLNMMIENNVLFYVTLILTRSVEGVTCRFDIRFFCGLFYGKVRFRLIINVCQYLTLFELEY